MCWTSTIEFKLKYPAALDMIITAGYASHIFCPKCTRKKGMIGM